MAVVWTPIAESDLDDILYYVSVVDRRPETGERIYCEIRHRLDEQDTKQLPVTRFQIAKGLALC